MLKREEIARIKERYPKGTPICLYSMEGEQTVLLEAGELLTMWMTSDKSI